jgi:hypothetical protein
LGTLKVYYIKIVETLRAAAWRVIYYILMSVKTALTGQMKDT